MASGQINTQDTVNRGPGLTNRIAKWSSDFMGRRAREAGYGAMFASIFLLCQSPANSLAIDDIRVLSKLGEPLLAEIAVTPAAGEVVSRGCFSARRSTGDLPGVGTVSLTLSRSLNTNVLSISGKQPMREPLSEFVLQVKCPGLPSMFKSFLVMVDPPAATAATAETPATIVTTTPISRPVSRPAPITSRQRTTASTTNPIQPGSRYRVRSGDTLSTIASRVSQRPDWSVWPIAQAIYSANPGAFLLGDPNVIAEGSVVFVPKLSDIDMSLASAPRAPSNAQSRSAAVSPEPAPAANTTPVTTVAENPAFVAQDNATRPVSREVAVTAPVEQPQPASARSAGLDQIMPTPVPATTPVAATAPATPLPRMQLTASLLDESKVKIMLRAQGSPVPAVITQAPVNEAPVETLPEPQSEPERPDSAVTDNRAVLPPSPTAQVETRLNWLWILVGLFSGLLVGALAAVSLFRRNLRHEYEHDVQDAVQRQLQLDRQRQQSQPVPASPGVAAASPAPAAMDLDESVEPSDYSVEMSTTSDLDLELPSTEEPAKTGAPETLEMPEVGSELDLHLPASDSTGKTGQHEVDFDLLEAAYSEDYQSEFVKHDNENVETVDDSSASSDSSAGDDSDDLADDSGRFYHLENRDPTDETPLPIELGEDEMGVDAEEPESKVVRFRR